MMLIDEDLLLTWGANTKKFKKGDIIFHEGEAAFNFYQVHSGRVKMYNTNELGKEFTQGEFKCGESFGEPPLFINEGYPASAVACENAVLFKISKERFFAMLDAFPELQRKLLVAFAHRIFNKSLTTRDIVNSSPEERILAFLQSYKRKSSKENEVIEIPYTRQEIANFTGLRVETVIRTLTKMKEKNKAKIVNRKLLF